MHYVTGTVPHVLPRLYILMLTSTSILQMGSQRHREVREVDLPKVTKFINIPFVPV